MNASRARAPAQYVPVNTAGPDEVGATVSVQRLREIDSWGRVVPPRPHVLQTGGRQHPPAARWTAAATDMEPVVNRQNLRHSDHVWILLVLIVKRQHGFHLTSFLQAVLKRVIVCLIQLGTDRVLPGSARLRPGVGACEAGVRVHVGEGIELAVTGTGHRRSRLVARPAVHRLGALDEPQPQVVHALNRVLVVRLEADRDADVEVALTRRDGVPAMEQRSVARRGRRREGRLAVVVHVRDRQLTCEPADTTEAHSFRASAAPTD